MKNKIIVIIIAIAILCVLIALPSSKTIENNKINIYTSAYSFQLLATEIGGDKVSGENLYPINSDPHSYEISFNDAKDIVDSDLVLYISEADDKEISDLAQTDNDETLYVDLATNDTFKSNVESELYENDMLVNEHIWISPKKLMVVATVIEQQLVQIDPENKDFFETNYQEVMNRLEIIDNQYTEFAREQKKPLIITHDAYFYLAHDYGIEYIPLYGAHHDDEPSANKIINVIDVINQNDINYLLVEQNDPNNEVMVEIGNETGAELKVINNMSSNSSINGFEDMDIYELLEYNLDVMKECGM